MAIYFEDWSSHAAGAQPTGWTEGQDASTSVWEILADAAYPGGKKLRWTPTGGGGLAIIGQLLRTDLGTGSTWEIAGSFVFSGTWWGARPAVLRAATAAPFTGYVGQVTAGGTRNLRRQTARTTGTTLDTEAGSALVAGTRYGFRLRSVAGVVQWKLWAWDAGATDYGEPAGWTLDATDGSPLASGYVGLGSEGHTSTPADTLDFGPIGISTAGETAPLAYPEGTEELIIYEEDDATEWASCSSSILHPRPYLMPVESYGDAEIDLLKGTATIGQENLSILDKRTDADDQGSGWFSAKLATADGESALIGHRAVRRRFTGGAWITVLDGVIGDISLAESKVAYQLTIRDIRERERKARAWYRTGTSTVFPRGVFGGYGLLPNGTYLIPPTVPVPGLFKRSSSDVGVFRPDLDPNDADSARRVVFTDHMRKAAEPLWDEEAGSLTLDRVSVLWRPEGGGAWTTLEFMTLPEQVMAGFGMDAELFETRTISDRIFRMVFGERPNLPGTTVELILGVRMVATPDAVIPANNQRVEIVVRYDGPASPEFPWLYDGDFGELARNLYRGDYSTDQNNEPVNPRIRYDEAALLANTKPCRVEVTKPVDDLREWMERNWYQPQGAAPAVFDGEIVPVYYELPAVDEVLPVLDDSNSKNVRWKHGEGYAANVVRLNYERHYYVADDPLALRSNGASIAARKVEIEYTDQPSRDLLGEKAVEIETDCLRSLGGRRGRMLTGDVMDETPSQLARERAKQAIDRFRYGGQHIVGETTLDLVPGDWVLVQIAANPDYRTLRRSLAPNLVDVTERLAQVVSVKRVNPRWSEIELVDAGAVNQPALAPTLGVMTASAAGVVSVPVTAVGADSFALVEYAVSTLEPAASSGLWIPLGRTDVPATLSTPPLPAGVTVWVRAKGVRAGERSSLYTTAVSITLPETPRLTDLDIRFDVDGNASLVWTPNAYANGARILFDIHLPDVEAVPAGSFDADASLGGVAIPTPIPTDYVLTVDVTGYTGWTGSAVSGTAGETQRIKEQRIKGPWIHDLTLTHDPVGTVNALVELNDEVLWWEVLDRVDAPPVTGGGAPDGAYSKGEYRPDEDTASWSVGNGEHFVLVRAYGSVDKSVFTDRSASIVVTGVPGDGDGGTSPGVAPGTPNLELGAVVGSDQEVTATWVNTLDGLDMEIRYFVNGGLTPHSTDTPAAGAESDTQQLPHGGGLNVVSAEIRYTNAPADPGPWSPRSNYLGLTG